MNQLTIRKAAIAMFFGLLSVSQAADKGFDAVDGPNVRVLRHDDGSKTQFERSPDNLILTTRMYGGDGTLRLRTVYRMDKDTNPISCKIYDGSNTELYRIRYGYRKSDGQLVAEEMFDSRTVRRDPRTGKEMPVRSIQYFYDEKTGKRSAPFAVTTQKGESAEEVFAGKIKIQPFTPEDNPFKKEVQAAPPSLKR